MSGAAVVTPLPVPVAPARRPGVVGYIDANSGNRLFGWAWDQDRPTARIAIRLVANGDTVAALLADKLRADLKANGIGDGAHAFEIDLPDGLTRETAEIHAVCPETGETVLLNAPPPAVVTVGEAPAAGETLTRLIRSHQHLHRTVREAMTAIAELRERTPEPVVEAPADSPAVDPMIARLEAIEAAVLRIDALVAEQQVKLRERRSSGGDRLSRAMSAFAVILAGAALIAAVAVNF